MWHRPRGTLEADIPTREAEGAMFRANPARTGAHIARGPMGPKVRVKWRYEMEEPRIEASPAVSGRAVYLGSYRGPLHAIDAETGEPLWHTEVDGFFRSSPTITDSTVYVGSEDRHVYVLSAETGRVRWRFETKGAVRSAPAVVERTVYVGSIDNGAYADSAFAKEWVTSESRLYALDAATGEARWTVEVGGRVASSPTVAGGVVYVGNDAEDYYDGGIFMPSALRTAVCGGGLTQASGWAPPPPLSRTARCIGLNERLATCAKRGAVSRCRLALGVIDPSTVSWCHVLCEERV